MKKKNRNEREVPIDLLYIANRTMTLEAYLMRSPFDLLPKSALVFFFLLAFHPVAHAQKLVLAAGEPNSRKILSPFGVACDAAGNLYIAEAFGHRVLKLDAKGSLTAIAGNGKKGDGGDGGPALEGQFNFMHDLIVAKNGDVYVADSDNYRVRKIDAKTGILSTVAGVGKKD